MSEDRAPGTDTPTGTDPDAEWSEPGYEDKRWCSTQPGDLLVPSES